MDKKVSRTGLYIRGVARKEQIKPFFGMAAVAHIEAALQAFPHPFAGDDPVICDIIVESENMIPDPQRIVRPAHI
jgi:hypothetical protein